MLPVVSQTIAATPPLLSVKMAYFGPKTGLTRGHRRKFASEAYGAIGGVTRNSIANRAIVGHFVSKDGFGKPQLAGSLGNPVPVVEEDNALQQPIRRSMNTELSNKIESGADSIPS